MIIWFQAYGEGQFRIDLLPHQRFADFATLIMICFETLRNSR